MMKRMWTSVRCNRHTAGRLPVGAGARFLALLYCAAVSSPLTVAAQEKQVLSPEEYGRWESLGRPLISPFGDWVATVVTRNDEDSQLRVTPVGDTDETVVVPFGEGALFSPDGHWVAWFVGTSPDEEEEALLTAELMNLESGDRRELGEASDLAFGPGGSSLAILSYADEDGSGSDLRIFSLADSRTTTFGSVSAMEWHDTKSLMAMTIATDNGQGNGIQVYSASTGAVQGLHSSTSEYLPPVWR